MALLITFLAGVSIIIGAFVSKLSKNPERIEHLSIALALGSLLSLMVFDLGPEVIEATEYHTWWKIAVCVLAGVLGLKILDMFLPDHEDTAETHDHENAAHIGIISALAVILHNIVEGMTVYSLTDKAFDQGLIFAIGVSLHNIPMGMMIYSTLNEQRQKRTTKRAILSIVTISTLIGGLLMFFLRELMTEPLKAALVSVATGMIIYIVFFELIPHVWKTKPVKTSIMWCLVGFALVFISCQFG